MKKIVVVGGGAGGLELATLLGRKLGKNSQAEVTLVDKNICHLWKPLLHEIATGVLDDDIDDINYIAQAHRNNFNFKLGQLLGIDREHKYVVLGEVKNETGILLIPESKLHYDVLVMAIGSTSNDFGTPGVRENCIFLDDQNAAKRLRQNLLSSFTRFSTGLDKKDKIRISIVGGGATGVELAAELFGMVKKLQDYGVERISSAILEVTLIEATDRILPALPEKVALSITQQLRDFGINVLTKTMITKADKAGFYTNEGDVIQADMMIWTAGVKAPDFLKNIADLESSRSNQLLVTAMLQTTKDESIFAIGDCAASPKPSGGYTPPTAQAAHQMAAVCADNVVAYLTGKPLREFKYKDNGTVISLSETAQGVINTLGASQLTVKGNLASMIHRGLYRMHQVSLLGPIKTMRVARSGKLLRSVKPTLKLD